MATPFTQIPNLDLTNTPKPQLLSTLHHALTSIGFLYISNHGVPEPVIADLVDVLPSLFALPDPVKNEVALCNSPHFLGYSQTGAEVTAGKVDFREQFEFANDLEAVSWEDGNDGGVPVFERLKGPNQWPSHPNANIKHIVETYIAELSNLANRFLRLVAESLSLPDDIFFPFLSEQHRLKLVHYPRTTTAESPRPQRQGVGPHKDSSGWWTFLLQASPPPTKGLQALNKEGTWIDIPPIPGTFVVNIGQAFEVVTNGLCKATTHRVLSGSAERFSVPFFQGVRGDLTKEEAVGTLRGWFEPMIAEAEAEAASGGKGSAESDEGRRIDSPFLRGKCETWGEAQLRIKIRSHRDVGRRFYGGLYEKYVNDD